MAKFYRAENTGKGFVTHEDQEVAYVGNIFDDVYYTENEAWAIRVGATEITEEQARIDWQSSKDATIASTQDLIDNETDEVQKKFHEYELAGVSASIFPLD